MTSTSRYIDIDSSYRNRLSYPDIGNFVVPVNTTSFASNAYTAKDPVLLAFPYDTGLTYYMDVNTDFGQPLLEVGIGTPDSDGAMPIINFYNGNYIQIYDNFFRIISYSYTGPGTSFPYYVVCDQDWPGGYANYPASNPVYTAPPYNLGNTGAGLQYTIRYELPVSLNGYGYGNTGAFTPVYQEALSPLNPYPLNYPSGKTVTREVILGTNASTRDGAYVGKYLFSLPPIYLFPWIDPYYPEITSSSINSGLIFNLLGPGYEGVLENVVYTKYQWSLITAYTGATKTATLKSAFLLGAAFDPLVPIGTFTGTYEILNYSYDNFRCIKYAGTETYNNPRCASVSLSNLIIPSYIPITNINAGYITDYPFVWVAVYSDKGQTYQQPIMSNAPASNKALFKCRTLYNQPTKFLSLGSTTNGQAIYFKQDDDLHVEILLPNGQPIRFTPALYTAVSGGKYTFFPGASFPIPPDPQAQVYLTLSVSYVS
jgi:hypothetical protein